MNYVEYGKDNQNTVILLHGGGLSWWNYEETAKLLQNDYRVIIPILDGHAGSDMPFTTIENNASEIISFIDENLGGHVLMIGGLSLGGQVLLEILSRRNDICNFAVIESALAIPSKLTYALIKPAFGSSYGLIKHEWFSKLQFKSLRIKPELFDHYYRDTRAISKANMIAFLEANSTYTIKNTLKNCTARSYILVGEKESKVMKRSAKLIHNHLSNSTLEVLTGLYHGEFSINLAESYVNKIKYIIER